MNNKPVVVARINFRNIKLAYIITAIVIGCIVIQDIVFMILAALDVFHNSPENMTVSLGNYLFLTLILSAVFIPSRNFRKMMNLGSKRADFFKGCAINYVIMAAVISLLSMGLYFTYDKLMVSLFYRGGTLDVLYWFRWIENGPMVAFFQQFAFLLLAAVAIHTLTAAQEKWYGWAADAVIVAIIAVFTPIAPLRSGLVLFFNLIIFHQYAWLQIAVCIFLAAAIYALNRSIFARKAI